MTKFCIVYGTWKTTANFTYFHLELNAVVVYLALVCTLCYLVVLFCMCALSHKHRFCLLPFCQFPSSLHVFLYSVNAVVVVVVVAVVLLVLGLLYFSSPSS